MTLRNQLVEVVESIWEASIGGPIRLVDAPANADANDGSVSARIDFTGAWSGSLRTRCSASLARRVAASMFACADEDATAEDLRDAVGEVANIIGGNVKALLPAPCEISVPCFDPDSSGSMSPDTLHFDSEGELMSLSLDAR